MTAKLPVDRKRAFRIAGALVGLAVVLGACTHTEQLLRYCRIETSTSR